MTKTYATARSSAAAKTRPAPQPRVQSGWDLKGKPRVGFGSGAWVAPLDPGAHPGGGGEGGQTDGLSLSGVRQQMLLLLLFWDFMDSSKRRTCWQQGGVGKDSQWGGGLGEGGSVGRPSVLASL